MKIEKLTYINIHYDGSEDIAAEKIYKRYLKNGWKKEQAWNGGTIFKKPGVPFTISKRTIKKQ